MPELDGFNAALQLRDMGLNCPIILLSADVFEDPGKQLDKVFNLTMTKPFSKQQLLEAIAAQQVKYSVNVPKSVPTVPGHQSGAEAENDDLLVEYRQSLPAYVEKIEKLITQQELDKLQRLLHQIKGTSACFGLTEISESAQIALQALKTGSLDSAAIAQLQNQLSAAGT